MNSFIDLTFLSSFDWFSILFILIFVVQILMGFAKGWLKSILKLVVIVAAVGLAFAFFKPVGDMIYSTSLGGTLTDKFSSLMVVANDRAGAEMDKEALDNYLRAQNQTLPEFLHSLYATTPFPKAAYESLDKLVIANIDASAGSFTIAGVIAPAIAQEACLALGFGSVLLGSFIVLLIVSLIITGIVKKIKSKPGALSRILGGLVGAVYGFALCWVLGIVLNSIIGLGNEWGDAIAASTHVNDSSSWWGPAKWMMNIDVSAVTNWFTSLVR